MTIMPTDYVAPSHTNRHCSRQEIPARICLTEHHTKLLITKKTTKIKIIYELASDIYEIILEIF